MMDDLHAKFLPQLLGLARTRLARALDVANRAEHDALPSTVRDLHALAGEAGLLGMTTLVPLARACEDKAKEMHVSRTDADRVSLLESLNVLQRAIELVETTRLQGRTT